MDLVLALHGIQGKYLGGMGEGEVSWGCMAGRVQVDHLGKGVGEVVLEDCVGGLR